MPVREISGRIQARSRRCSGNLIQSSQKLEKTLIIRPCQHFLTYPAGQLAFISFQTVFVSNQPSPGKKSVRCRRALQEI